MSRDHFTEVTRQSWGGRLGGAFKGIIFGLLLVLVAFPLLFWNEGRAVKRYRSLQEGGAAVIAVVADRVDPANEGRLIHVSGRTAVAGMLTDPAFGMSVEGVKLKRTVQMYQWKETSKSQTEKKLGGGTETVTTYDYGKTWSSTFIDSSSFREPQGHENPRDMPYRTVEQRAPQVLLGAFRLSPSLVAAIDDYQPQAMTGENPLPAEIEGRGRIHDGGFYIGADPFSPGVGDLRISFQAVLPGDVSLISKQTGDTFVPYPTKAGGTLELLQTGVVDAAAMIQTAQRNNMILTWGIRLGGFLLFFLGLNLMLRPLSVLADVLPWLGTAVGAGTGTIAFLLAAMLTLLTVALSWIFHRPLLGALLLALALALGWAVRTRLKSSRAAV